MKIHLHKRRLIIIFFSIFTLQIENILSQEISTTTQNINEINNSFAFDFYHKISAQDNIFFSPFSILSSFAIAYEGSAGKTKQELEKTFHFPHSQNETAKLFTAILSNFNTENNETTVKMYNSLWLQKDYHFLPEYLNMIKNNYLAENFDANFKTQPEQERENINNWVKDKTKGKIENLIPPGTLNSLTRLVLINAIYFKGIWEIQFDKTQTFNDSFIKDKKSFPVKMMKHSKELELPYYNNPIFQMIELPYKNKTFSMYILLPTGENIKDIEKNLNYANFKLWEKEMILTKIKVFMPKFKLEFFTKLNEIISQMGINTAFNENANFQNMDGTKRLYIQKAFHKARIEVDEEGSQAEASSSIAFAVKAIMLTPVFKVNKPFLFLIKDKRNNLILFVGKVSDPSKL